MTIFLYIGKTENIRCYIKTLHSKDYFPAYKLDVDGNYIVHPINGMEFCLFKTMAARVYCKKLMVFAVDFGFNL